MPIDEIQKVCFVGAGTMGCVNSLVCGMAGYESVVYDVSQEALSRVPLRHEMIATRMVEERGFYTYPDAPWMKPEFLTDEGSNS